jgi:CRP-like cAMP-binding protein
VKTNRLQEGRILDSDTSPGMSPAFIQGLRLLAGISPADCRTIISCAHEKRFWRHQTVFFVGDPIDQVFLLLSGCVKITQQNASGNEVILRMAGSGEVVGTLRLWSECKHGSTVRVVQPGSALVWDAATFDNLLQRFATFERNMFCTLEECLEEMEQRFREISTESVASRVSSELIRLSKHLTCDANGHFEIRMELAQLTAATLSTVSRLLCRWQASGIVGLGRGTVKVHDSAALAHSATQNAKRQ